MKPTNPISKFTSALVVFSLFTTSVHADKLNGTGQTGAAGMDGKSYSPSVRSSSRGDVRSRSECKTSPGRNATAGSNAGNGGRGSDFNLSLSDNGTILVMGTETSYRDGVSQTKRISKETEITDVLQIYANGGRGGLPGQGGDGEGAQQGQDSSMNARNETEDGGDGCDAGTPGNGANSGIPGDGGPGGDIRVKLSSDDTHLLLAISTEAFGGQPGNVLPGGRAGDTARGGDGGKGFYEDRSGDYPTGRMIDEPGCTPRKAGDYGTGRFKDKPGCKSKAGYYKTEKDADCDFESTTAAGVEKIEYVCKDKKVWVDPVTCDQVEITEYKSEIRCKQVAEKRYKTVIVRTEDGRTGRASPSAKDGKASSMSGSQGPNGTVVFEVADSQTGVVTRYSPADQARLEMLDYDMIDEDGNGIFEPGESVRLTNLKIRNNGSMPYTFTKAQTLVFLKTESWLVADPQAMIIPKIQAGQTITIQNPGLTFKIRSNTFRAGPREPVWEETILPHNRITRIERSWRGLELARTFYITFPVRLTSFEVPSAIQVGQSVEISWGVQNLSSMAIPDLGSAARKVRTDIGFDSPHMTGDQVSIQLNDQKEQKLSQNLLQMISGLKPNETRVIKGTLTVSSDVEPYSMGELKLGLFINQYNAQNMVEVQNQSASIRVERVYRANANDDLLIVLTESDKKVFRAWTQLFKKLGLQGNIWDLSIDGGFSFFGSLSNGGTISSDFKNKSVVLPKLLDRGDVNYFLTRAHEQLYETAVQNQNSLYLVGYDVPTFQALLSKYLQTNERKVHANENIFLSSLQKNLNLDPGTVHEVNIEESYYFAKRPRADKLFETKSKIESQLKTKYPDKNFIVTIDFNPSLKSSGIKHTYTLGKVYVRAGVSYEQAKLVLLSTQNNPYSDSFIRSADNTRALCLSLNPQARLKALKATSQLTGSDAETFKIVLDCIQFDIYQEWFKANRKLERTDYYLTYIKDLFSSYTPKPKQK